MPKLETNLGDYLDCLREVHPRLPKDYLNEWCDDQLLRKIFDSSDDPLFTLTSATEKAIAWLEELQKREDFIGTESRFLQIFDLLKEIQDRSTTDVEIRIAQLEKVEIASSRRLTRFVNLVWLNDIAQLNYKNASY